MAHLSAHPCQISSLHCPPNLDYLTSLPNHARLAHLTAHPRLDYLTPLPTHARLAYLTAHPCQISSPPCTSTLDYLTSVPTQYISSQDIFEYNASRSHQYLANANIFRCISIQSMEGIGGLRIFQATRINAKLGRLAPKQACNIMKVCLGDQTSTLKDNKLSGAEGAMNFSFWKVSNDENKGKDCFKLLQGSSSAFGKILAPKQNSP